MIRSSSSSGDGGTAIASTHGLAFATYNAAAGQGQTYSTKLQEFRNKFKGDLVALMEQGASCIGLQECEGAHATWS